MNDPGLTILVSGGTLSSTAHLSALNFVETALVNGQSIACVFFYAGASDVANALNTPLSDELDASKTWQALKNKYGLDLSVCIASAERRGVIGELSQQDHDLSIANLADGFRVVGLAELHDAMLQTSKTVHFS